jgi:hypothetical protein
MKSGRQIVKVRPSFPTYICIISATDSITARLLYLKQQLHLLEAISLTREPSDNPQQASMRPEREGLGN